MVSIGPILAVPGIRAGAARQPRPGGRLRRHPRRGPGARHGPPAAARRSGSRSTRLRSAGTTVPGAAGGVLDVWAMDTADAGSADRVRDGRAAPGGHRPDHERPGGDRRVHRLRGQVRHGDDHDLRARTGSARSPPATIWPRCVLDRGGRRPGRAAGRRRHRRRHLQDHQQGRGPDGAGRGAGGGDPGRDGPDGGAPGRDHDRPHPDRADAGRRRAWTTPTSTRRGVAAARRPGRQCRRGCALRCSSGPACGSA